MMKKIKIISIAITIFAIIFGISLKVCFSHNKDEQTIAENDVIDESKKTEIENEETQTIVEIPVEENIAESNMQNNDIAPQAEDDTEKPKKTNLQFQVKQIQIKAQRANRIPKVLK